jgi:hypothetical protein
MAEANDREAERDERRDRLFLILEAIGDVLVDAGCLLPWFPDPEFPKAEFPEAWFPEFSWVDSWSGIAVVMCEFDRVPGLSHRDAIEEGFAAAGVELLDTGAYRNDCDEITCAFLLHVPDEANPTLVRDSGSRCPATRKPKAKAKLPEPIPRLS